MFPTAIGTIGRSGRRPATSQGQGVGGTVGGRGFVRNEESERIAEADEAGEMVQSASRDPMGDEEVDRGLDKEVKPVFLKGLFR